MANLDFKKYGKSENGNFSIVDSVPVPHPYMITPKHLEFVADNNHGILDEHAIMECEKRGIYCAICKNARNQILPFSEHKLALLVGCKADLMENKDEIKEFILRINDATEKDGYVGFVFRKDF